MSDQDFKVLSLDGGGSKGVYTLGVLTEIEAFLKKPLWESFNLMYGTSTGAIIAALLALGKSVKEVRDLYFEHIPTIMKHNSPRVRSSRLRAAAKEMFGNVKFADFKTDIGIVSMHIDYARPMIFKSSMKQAHGRKSSFDPGFGATVVDAIMASCAAFPFFEKVSVTTKNQGMPCLLDGGFVANNPTLFALADALNAYEVDAHRVKLLSLGVGVYREPARKIWHEILLNFWPFWLVRKTLDCNTNTNEIIRQILFKNIPCVRISDTFAEKNYETDMLESDFVKLEKMFQLGRESFAKKETEVVNLFKETQ